MKDQRKNLRSSFNKYITFACNNKLVNKEKRKGAGSIIAIIKGTDVKTVTSILLKLPRRRHFQVRE